MKKMLCNKKLMGIYAVAFVAMGSFACTYNYISYVFIAPPYNLSQTAIGFIFTLYLVGAVASMIMGNLSDRYGSGKMICVSILLMLGGIFITLAMGIVWKIIGLAIFTYGFFGTHCVACGWAGKSAKGDKAQASSMYIFYYIGASVMGTIGGTFLSDYGWAGVVYFIAALIGMALLIAVRLTVDERSFFRTNHKSDKLQ